ncbi:MAG: hypothetical protein BGO13_08195 [Burkholderiales bacterium 66-5]|nr:MAG: hypothetical protein BGO13_08195 [Burkholderiales bacterium 66-5]
MLRRHWLTLPLALAPFAKALAGERTLLNAAYDATREFYADYNALFVRQWQERTGEPLAILQSHGGSGAQARAVLDGLRADVVSLALAPDVDRLARQGLVDGRWREALPLQACPMASTIVFLVRKGNPHGIRGWDDLLQPGLTLITPNPKISGGARWNWFAAWGHALRTSDSERAALDFMRQLFARVPVLDTGARSAAMSFIVRGMGDVLLAWESEAHLALQVFGDQAIEVVTPPDSILATLPVAQVQQVTERRGTGQIARAYLEALYQPEAQQLAARHHFRTSGQASAGLPQLATFTLEQVAGDWASAQQRHFAEGGVFDQIWRAA